MIKTPYEHDEQVAFFHFLKEWFPQYEHVCFSIPNGAVLAGDKMRRARQMRQLKAEGLKVNVPDIFCAVALWGYHGFFIEMKRKGKKPDADQLKMHKELHAQGYSVGVYDSWRDAIAGFARYAGERCPLDTDGRLRL